MGSSTIIKATLDRALAVGFYTIKISIDAGEPQAMTGSGTDFSFSYTPTDIGEQQFQIDIFDAKSEFVDSNGDSFTVISESSPTIPIIPATPVVTKTTGYSKIANNGSLLSDSAKLGTAPTDWACTKDNKTGLIWEVKTDDGGFRDKDYLYTWYEPDTSKNHGNSGKQNDGICKGIDCDSYAYTNAANSESLCGSKDWRLPTFNELDSLVYCSDGKYKDIGENEIGFICASNTLDTLKTTSPSINTDYFPNTQGDWFLSSSTHSIYSNAVWIIVFYHGYKDFYGKNSNYNVRLVH